jgi:hypothetical protein
LFIIVLFFITENVMVDFKWGEVIIRSSVSADAGLEVMKNIAIDNWLDDLLPIDFVFKNGKTDTLVTDESCRSLLLSNAPLLKIVSCAVGFSRIKKTNVLEWAGVDMIEDDDTMFKESDCLDTASPDVLNIVDHAIQHLRYTDRVYGPIVDCLEASVREYIGVILLACALISGDIKMSAEKEICGKKANGPLDYAMMYKEFYILITEAKKDDILGGMTQNLAQVVASREQYLYSSCPTSTKRSYMDMAGQIAQVPSTGIVSSGKDWIIIRYLRREDGMMHAIKSILMTLPLGGGDEELKRSVISLISKIIGAIKLQKDAIESVSYTQRRRTSSHQSAETVDK